MTYESFGGSRPQIYTIAFFPSREAGFYRVIRGTDGKDKWVEPTLANQEIEDRRPIEEYIAARHLIRGATVEVMRKKYIVREDIIPAKE